MTSISTIGPDHNVDYYFNMPGVQLVQDDAGKVVAVIGKNEDTGGYVRFNVTKGVILATGSFINNQAMLARYNTQAVGYTAKVSGRLGDGHLMGVLAGGVLPNGIYTKMCHDNDTGPFQSVPLLCVNYDGERFINEEIDSTLWCNATARAKEKGRMFQVVDSTYPQICEALGMKPPTEQKILGCMPGTPESDAKGPTGSSRPPTRPTPWRSWPSSWVCRSTTCWPPSSATTSSARPGSTWTSVRTPSTSSRLLPRRSTS